MNKVWKTVYSDGGTVITPPPPATPSSPPPPPPPKTFTQEQLNTLLAQERRNEQVKSQKLIDELNALKAKSNLTDQERSELEQRIADLQSTIGTKEELAKREMDKLKKKYEDENTALKSLSEGWKSRYTDSTINRAITDAAVEHQAFVPSQIVAILKPNARLMEGTDEDGKPNGEYTVMVKFQDVDDKGKKVTLDLSVRDAVKRMREIEEHQNLFKGDGSGGLGSRNRGTGSSKDQTLADAAKQGPEAYREARKKQGIK